FTGRRCIKSYYDSYLRGWDNGTDWNVGTYLQCGKCEQWTIEEHNGKVSLKESCTGKYLRSNIYRFVDMAEKANRHELWTPVRYGGGKWAFKSFHNTYMFAIPNGRISLHLQVRQNVKFTLESWPEPEIEQSDKTTVAPNAEKKVDEHSENDSSEEDDKELTSQELAEVTGQRCVRTHSSAYLR
ncbi:hypothetical protein PMAYCL1PPCAC_21710, partial [Pristionchus mayeri]